MENYDYNESNMCKFNFCPYYDFENDKIIDYTFAPRIVLE